MRRDHQRRPDWLKVPAFGGDQYHTIRKKLRGLELHTVCEEANCPNRGECFNSGTATFLLLGPICSRNCRFCNISPGIPQPVKPEEPAQVAQMAAALGLSYVVVTSVTRDDLPDEGAGQFRRTILAVRELLPLAAIEVLTPDFHGREDLLNLVLDASPTVFNHNVETVPRLYPEVRPQANYAQSLAVLRYASRKYPNIKIKSGIMVGLGESIDELELLFSDLAHVGVVILTIGQYLAPSRNHYPIGRYYSPDEFSLLQQLAQAAGISTVISAPLVRSSYRAASIAE